MVTLADGFDIRFRRITQQIEQLFLDGVFSQSILPNRIDRAMWQEHYSRLLNHAEAGWGKRFTEAADLKEWERFQRIEQNLREFAALKQHRIIEELRQLKIKFPNRADWEPTARKLLNRHNVRYLRAELQASTAAAQAAESWAVFESRAYLYPNLRYETAGDERVRQSHRSLDGVIRPVNHPFWDMYYPPNGWGCRCKVVQTDEEATTTGEGVDFEPAKGFRGNVGKTGQLFSEDHPYYNVSTLDREAIQNQAKAFHADVTRDQVRDWSATNLVPSFSMKLPELPQPATITQTEVDTITGLQHKNAPGRNELLYILALLSGDLKYIGTTVGNAQVKQWYYYGVRSGSSDYILNLWRVIDNGAERIGIQSISDLVPDIGGP
jgi:SPP1 gp7 family putative phage head morphogenesis protein